MTRHLLAILAMASFTLSAQTETQEADSVAQAAAKRKRIYSSPRKASIMSAILPGLGQAYNRKYWKVPVIYAGLGGLGYMFVANHQEYSFYRKHLIAENDENPATMNETIYSSEQLKEQKVYYKRYRDLAAIGVGLLYVINIIDANVDAHLRTFDVSDDLSLRISPWAPAVGTAGIQFRLEF